MAYVFYIPCIFFLLLAKTTAKVPAVIVFGDSSVDTGNNNQISTFLKSNFRPYGRDFAGGRPTGRFCNGRLPPDFISEAFGLNPTVPAYLDPMYKISDFAIGVCFASAGTGYDNATSDVLNVIPLWKEVDYYKDYQNKLRAYLGNRKANIILREALYLVSLGTNDFLENYYLLPHRRSQFTPKQYSDFLTGLAETFIREIYALGARKISLTGVPPMGCLPLERATNFLDHHDCNGEYNEVAMDFNGKLKGLVGRLNMELPRLKMVFADAYYIFQDIVRSPSVFGFEVSGVACCATGTIELGYTCNQHNPFTCSDANKFVFWDAFHPTDKTNHIIADYLLKNFLVQFR